MLVLDSAGDDYPEIPEVGRLDLVTGMGDRQEEGDFIYRLVPTSPDDFTFALNCAMALSHVTFLCDEMAFYVESRSFPEELSTFVRLGGHFGQDGIFITHLPVDYPRVVRANADEIYFYRLTEAADLKFAENYLKDRVRELPHLGTFEHLKYSKGRLDIQRGRCTLGDVEVMRTR